MIPALTTFTLLWAIGCSGLYFLKLRELERIQARSDEIKELYERAQRDNKEAREASLKAPDLLDQIDRSLHCLN